MQLGTASHHPALLLATATLLAVAVPVSAGDRAPAAHDQVRCGGCHNGRAFATTSTSQSGPMAAAIARQCVACHQGRQPASDGGRAFHDRADRACTACHSFHDPATLRAGDREFTVVFGDPGVQAHCRTCHQQGIRLGLIDDGHRFAAEAVYHDGTRDLGRMSPSDACLICHGTGGVALTIPDGVPEILQINTHASHPFGIRFQPGQGTGDGKIRRDVDPRLPLPDGKIECVTCHSIPGGTKDLMMPFDDPYALCLGCHQVSDGARDQGLLALVGGR